MESTNPKPKTIDEYLAGVNADHRGVLEKLRKVIHAVAPNASRAARDRIGDARVS